LIARSVTKIQTAFKFWTVSNELVELIGGHLTYEQASYPQLKEDLQFILSN
jgi:hypothetical protein